MRLSVIKRIVALSVSVSLLLGLGFLLSQSELREPHGYRSFFRLHGAAGDIFDLSSVPDGYPDGRATSPYGAYSTPYLKNARTISDALNALERKIYGLPDYARGNEAEQAKAVYSIEHQVLGILKDILNRPDHDLSAFERDSLKAKCVRLYNDVRYHGERLYHTMIRRVDVALPGPNGSQLRIEHKLANGATQVLYLSNCRMDKCPTEQERKDFYEKKLADFLKSGGKVTDMVELNEHSLKGFGPITRVEYVERPDGSVWVTQGDAGHALLAKGGAVQAAGQMVLIKNSRGQLEYIIISNASGTYKPDLYSAEVLATKLRHKFQVASSGAIVTEGEPLGTQTVKVLMKAAGAPKETISAEVKSLESHGSAFLNHRGGVCPAILASISKGSH